MQLQVLRNLRKSFRLVAVAVQAHCQVEMVIGIRRVGSLRLAKKCSRIVAPAADCYRLVVHHLGQRQHPGDRAKSLFRTRIVTGKDQRKSAIESGLKLRRVRRRDFAKAGSGQLIPLAGELYLPSRSHAAVKSGLRSVAFLRCRSRSALSCSVMPRMYCSKASRRTLVPVARKVSSATL